MSLNLPVNYKADIAGRDTALVPVIVIGNTTERDYVNWANNLYISTNSISLSVVAPGVHGEDNINFMPLLLNIPSLKESIDIEKRNYKISSINLDISNYEFEGLRFSERLSDSLINTESARILGSFGIINLQTLIFEAFRT